MAMELTKDSREDSATPQGGRRAAGEDPVKREQILDGAKRVFMEQGFDAASMNDITRAAGVSKGTIYVYFQNKEDLFGELIQRERLRITESDPPRPQPRPHGGRSPARFRRPVCLAHIVRIHHQGHAHGASPSTSACRRWPAASSPPAR